MLNTHNCVLGHYNYEHPPKLLAKAGFLIILPYFTFILQ